jgi:cytosine/adenosine deaminase-related metal-dependent hydrolase
MKRQLSSRSWMGAWALPLVLVLACAVSGCGDGGGKEDGEEDAVPEDEGDGADDVQADEPLDDGPADPVDADTAEDTALEDGADMSEAEDGPDADDFDAADTDVTDLTDAEEEEGVEPPPVIHCADLVPPASGTCDITAGGSALLIRGIILAPTSVLEGGEVLVSAAGTILCVDCSCSSMPEAAGATVLTCASGVVSPGLINAHDHLTYTQNLPGSWGTERYEQRHDWRRGLRGHTKLGYSGGASEDEMTWGELRQVIAGTTSITGSGGASGFLRNIDRDTLDEGLGQGEIDYQTFPLGDGTSATQIRHSCAYPSIDDVSVLASDCYLPHVAEGIDDVTRNEFLCLSSTDRGGVDLTAPSSVFVHGVGLQAEDGAVLASEGTAIVWSPRSNISLYGNTAPVTMYRRQGVLLALGTDWTPSGSATIVRELACAALLNDRYFGGAFDDSELWLMATGWAAEALAVDDAIGLLAPGLTADIAVYDAHGAANPFRSIIEARAQDTVLVLRGGLPLYGATTLMDTIPGGQAGCEPIPGDVCGEARTACVSRETGGTGFAALQTANVSSYGLFFCGTPTGEPTCVPSRPGEYSGTISAGDGDGDGIADASDDCPGIFNPVRPLDGAGQADQDGDGMGDVCDPCPLDTDNTGCLAASPGDRDLDGVADGTDNCPFDYNPGQADGDGDGHGNACDFCPAASNQGTLSCPVSIYDVKQGMLWEGTEVAVTGVVTAVASPRFFVQVPEDQLDIVLGKTYSGIYVYIPASNPQGIPIPSVGDLVTVAGRINVYYGQIELDNITDAVVLASGTPVPSPETVTTAAVCTGCTDAAAYEGVLVRVEHGEVTALNPPAGPGDSDPTQEYVLDALLRVNDFLYLTSPFPIVGDIMSVSGVLRLASNDSKLEPRRASDVVFESALEPHLRSFGPSPVFVDEGTTGVPTVPPLQVMLLRPAPPGGAVVSLVSADTGLLAVPASVTVPEGLLSTNVSVSGIAGSAAAVDVTATLGTESLVASVVVIASGRVPAPVSVDPSTGSVAVGRNLELTVTLDIPARPGGTTASVTVSDPAVLGAPALLSFPEWTRTASLTVSGLMVGGPVTVTVSTASGSAAAAIGVTEVVGTPIFSEYVEGSSYNKALEIYNGGPDPLDLGTCVVNRYMNGSASPMAIDLDAMTLPSGGVFVLCHTSISDTSRCDMLTGSLLHNGNDALELVCAAATLDVIGQIGFDPGSAGWGTGSTTTTDHTLRRRCDVVTGDTSGADAFNPALEWDGYPSNTLDDLGTHCP